LSNKEEDFFRKSDSRPQIVYDAGHVFGEVTEVSVTNAQREQIGKYIAANITTLTGVDSRLSDQLKSAIRNTTPRYGSLQRELHSVMQYTRSPDAFSTLPSDVRAKMDKLSRNMNFLGIHLGETPQFGEINGLWLLAILSFIFSAAQITVQQYIQKRSMPDAPKAPGMKFMFVMMPMFSLFIVFSVPAGAGLYWTVSYLIMIAQSIIIYKFWPPEKMREEARARVEAKLGAVAVTATIVDVDDEGNEFVRTEKLSDMSAKEQKEYFRKKIEAARKADLEKYGETEDIDWSEYDKKEEPEPETENNDSEEET